MKLAYWPGLGGAAEPVAALELDGFDAVWLDPRYDETANWDLDVLAARFVATGADVYAGHSWGGAIAARAALSRPPAALVLLEGGFLQPPRGEQHVQEVVASAPEHDWAYGTATLEALLRSYMRFDAEATLASLPRETRVLILAGSLVDGRAELARRAAELVPHADVHLVQAGHDVIEDLGGDLGELVGGWLRSEVAA